MTLASLINEPCTITNWTTPNPLTDTGDGPDYDEFGNIAPVDETIDTVCYREQRSTIEVTVDENTVTADWLFMFGAGTDIAATSTITVGDDTFAVVGKPWPARNPRTRTVHHVECNARQVT